MKTEHIFKGEHGYVQLDETEHNGHSGLLLRFVNPAERKLHAVDVQGLKEFEDALDEVEQRASDAALGFLILYGAYDPLHAGADVTQFAGDPDIDAIRDHLYRGVELDTRIKALWPRLRTIGVFCGNRFGGSVEWPLFAEYGVADTATTIQLSEVQLGILSGWNGILNVMLRSNPSNAQYMATTGNPIGAAQMKQIGLAHAVVDAPPAPDRRLAGDNFAQQWAAHASECQRALLDAALELGAGELPPPADSRINLTDAESYSAEIGRRTQDTEYRELRDVVRARFEKLGSDPDPDDIKALHKFVNSELALLGKPLAPEAVNLGTRFVKQYGALSREELLRRADELGHVEADLCIECMLHPHRREGVNAVLSKDPAERIPVFAEVDYNADTSVFA